MSDCKMIVATMIICTTLLSTIWSVAAIASAINKAQEITYVNK